MLAGYSTHGFQYVSKLVVCLHHHFTLDTTQICCLEGEDSLSDLDELVIKSLLAIKETRNGKYYQYGIPLRTKITNRYTYVSKTHQI